MQDLARFFNPKSIVTFGGSWAANVIAQLQKSGFKGDIWPVHPYREDICGIKCFTELSQIPGIPDAAFVGVNREQSVQMVAELAAMKAGGAICFASGFNEAGDQTGLQRSLIDAAGDMPLLGPNCYGFINYVDNVTLWPDQHGGSPVESGVAIIAQSSNIAINMSMQQRGLSIAYLFTAGNQGQIGVSGIAQEMVANARVNAIGLYLEGFDDIRGFEAMAHAARAAGKPIVALKIGKTEKAQAATISHTATLAGGAAASSALLRRLGIVEVNSISEFLEALKLLSAIGPLNGTNISSVSCSGGEASLMSDLSQNSNIVFRDYSEQQLQRLAKVLGPKVDLANPLDYHTYIWGDVPVMTACFEAVMQSDFDLNVFVLDLPRADLCDPIGHDCAVESIIAAQASSGAAVAVIALLPENLDEGVSQRFLNAGVVPLHDMQIGLSAIDAAIRAGELARAPLSQNEVVLRNSLNGVVFETVNEGDAKKQLQVCGVNVPNSISAMAKQEILVGSEALQYPLVLKGQGIAHKTEQGAVILGIDSQSTLSAALKAIPNCTQGYLLEEMVSDVVAELIVGVTFDKTGLCLLTLGSGGILTELLADSVTLLLPATRDEISQALLSIKAAKLLKGYRGKPAADFEQILDAVEAVQQYVITNIDSLEELDINPLMVGTKQSIAADALIRLHS